MSGTNIQKAALETKAKPLAPTSLSNQTQYITKSLFLFILSPQSGLSHYQIFLSWTSTIGNNFSLYSLRFPTNLSPTQQPLVSSYFSIAL